MIRSRRYILVFVLHVYIMVTTCEAADKRYNTSEICDCGITPYDVNSYFSGTTEPLEDGSKFPWMVAIKYRGSVQCSAAVITRSFVLTAGHCVHGEPLKKNQQCKAPKKEVTPGRCLNLEDITIAFVNRKAVLRTFYEIRDVFIHPDYQLVEGNKGAYTKNDIALINMKGAIRCTDYRKSICLPLGSSFTIPGRRTVIAGWGMTNTPNSNDARNAKTLKLTFRTLTIKQQDECEASWANEKNNAWFCAKANMTACKGDSGAPLITDGEDGLFYILGVKSLLSDPGCDAKSPQLFADVKKNLKWILDIVLCCP